MVSGENIFIPPQPTLVKRVADPGFSLESQWAQETRVGPSTEIYGGIRGVHIIVMEQILV
jgi:hypothetical protein